MHITYGDFWFLVWGQIKNKLFDSHYHPEIGNPLKGKDETPNFWKLPSWQNDLQGQKKKIQMLGLSTTMHILE